MGMSREKLMTAATIDTTIDALYKKIRSALPADKPIGVIGIRTRGETLARRFVERLAADKPELDVSLGVLDITFYRDDLSKRKGLPLVRATEIDFDLDDTFVVLVDDVLQTGRSIRAALDALHDFGRPGVIRLAVLLDRGGREVPIAADWAGKTLSVSPGQRIDIQLRENDGQEGAYVISEA